MKEDGRGGREDGGGWWKMVNGGCWWKMVEADRAWWRIMVI